MGRPLELTDEIAEVICQQVALGRSMRLAAFAAGFDRTTAVKWQKQGRADLAAGVDSVQARFVIRLARARGDLSDALTAKILRGLDEPPGQSNVRDALSVLKTFLPTFYGDRAADLDAAEEAAAEASDKADASPGQPGAVQVELVRCASCGEDQLPGKRLCGDCGAEMPKAGA